MSKFNVGLVIFPDLTQLDLTGPAGLAFRSLDLAQGCLQAFGLLPIVATIGLKRFMARPPKVV